MKNLLALVINIFTFVALRMLEEYSIYPMFFAFALAYLTYQNVVYRGLFFYASREFTTFWPLWWRVSYYESLSIRVQSTLNNISIFFYHDINVKENVFFFIGSQSPSWKRHCMTYWREQRCLNSYRQRQISQSNFEISSNCGKIIFRCISNFSVYVLTSAWPQDRGFKQSKNRVRREESRLLEVENTTTRNGW